MVFQSQGIGLFGNNDINSTCVQSCLIVYLYFSTWTYNRWVVLYNANLDRSRNNRKTTVELKKDLKRWEEERPKKKKLVVNDVLGYQVHNITFTISLLLTKHFIVLDNSQDRVLPTGQRCEADDQREDDANIY